MDKPLLANRDTHWAGFFVPAAGVALMIVAGPLYLVWFPLLARDFFRFPHGASQVI